MSEQGIKHPLKYIIFLLLEELNSPEIVASTEHWLNIDEPVFVKNDTTISRLLEVVYFIAVL